MAELGISDIGFFAILAAFALVPFGIGAAVIGARRRLGELVVSARRAIYAVALLEAVAFLVLLRAFAVHDFTIRYVAEQSSRDLPWKYTLAALYSGQAGSLLFWSFMLAIFSAIAIATMHRQHRQLAPYTIATLLVVQCFFLFLLNFVTNPFERLPFPIADGRGLNPLLVDTGLLVHPPFLLTGYMSSTIPFALAMAALLSGKLDDEWIGVVRKWSVISWAILGCGLILGAWWAYHVLGWGGYWGWDPVENAAFMPWLAATAFIHSIMVQERRGMLKGWNFTLVILTFNLSIFGTFLTRSGLITSVHSFAQSEIGPFFLGFLAVMLVGSLGLLFYRLPQLSGAGQFQSYLSREASFLLNNLLLVGSAFAIFWGTIFPLVSELIQGQQIAVGPPFFNQVNAPIYLALMLLMGIGPLLAWRRTSPATLVRSLRWPVLAAVVFAIGSILIGGPGFLSAIGFAACGFTLGAILLEFWRGVSARQRNSGEAIVSALFGLVGRNRRRYGGYIVHLGVVLFAIGALASAFYQVESEQRLMPGESMAVGGYSLTFQEQLTYQEPLASVRAARFTLNGLTGGPAQLEADKRAYRGWEQQPTTGVIIKTDFPSLNDVYVFVSAMEDNGAVTFHVFVNPLIILLWLGGAVFVAGTLIAIWPEPQPERRTVVERSRTKVVSSEA